MPGLDDLRRFAIARSLFAATSLRTAIHRLGFVQADPIRAPARAQDLTLRHRVKDYRAGDLERRYAALDVEEDVFINYGFVPREVRALMHPRRGRKRWPSVRPSRTELVLAFVRERGPVHPREVSRHFDHGTVTNYWGGSSNATTHLLEMMHYDGLLRVAGREGGIRVYASHDYPADPIPPAARRARVDALVDVVVRAYAPLPALSLSNVVARLRYAVPQWRGELKAALRRARERLSQARVEGIDWYWPAGERPRGAALADTVRLLGPFDPVVWDRRRFELFWGWPYRFEAYTPAAKRKFGYYALPLLWMDRIVGWSTISASNGSFTPEFGYVDGAAPREAAFRRGLDEELDRMRDFLKQP